MFLTEIRSTNAAAATTTCSSLGSIATHGAQSVTPVGSWVRQGRQWLRRYDFPAAAQVPLGAARDELHFTAIVRERRHTVEHGSDEPWLPNANAEALIEVKECVCDNGP